MVLNVADRTGPKNWARQKTEPEPHFRSPAEWTVLSTTTTKKTMTLHTTNWEYCPPARCNTLFYFFFLVDVVVDVVLFCTFWFVVFLFVLFFSVLDFFSAHNQGCKYEIRQKKKIKSVYVNHMQHTQTHTCILDVWGKDTRPCISELPPSCKVFKKKREIAYVAMLMLHTSLCVLVCTRKTAHVDPCYGQVPHEVNCPNPVPPILQQEIIHIHTRMHTDTHTDTCIHTAHRLTHNHTWPLFVTHRHTYTQVIFLCHKHTHAYTQ